MAAEVKTRVYNSESFEQYPILEKALYKNWELDFCESFCCCCCSFGLFIFCFSVFYCSSTRSENMFPSSWWMIITLGNTHLLRYTLRESCDPSTASSPSSLQTSAAMSDNLCWWGKRSIAVNNPAWHLDTEYVCNLYRLHSDKGPLLFTCDKWIISDHWH